MRVQQKKDQVIMCNTLGCGNNAMYSFGGITICEDCYEKTRTVYAYSKETRKKTGKTKEGKKEKETRG
jgi:hypothetical protein